MAMCYLPVDERYSLSSSDGNLRYILYFIFDDLRYRVYIGPSMGAIDNAEKIIENLQSFVA